MKKVDPPVRDDGKCGCGCGKLLPRSREAMRYAGRTQLESDPFASSACAQRWYGVSWAPDAEDEGAIERRRRGGRAASERRRAERGWKEPGTVPVSLG